MQTNIFLPALSSAGSCGCTMCRGSGSTLSCPTSVPWGWWCSWGWPLWPWPPCTCWGRKWASWCGGRQVRVVGKVGHDQSPLFNLSSQLCFCPERYIKATLWNKSQLCFCPERYIKATLWNNLPLFEVCFYKPLLSVSSLSSFWWYMAMRRTDNCACRSH